jgi:hypothetical protein
MLKLFSYIYGRGLEYYNLQLLCLFQFPFFFIPDTSTQKVHSVIDFPATFHYANTLCKAATETVQSAPFKVVAADL